MLFSTLLVIVAFEPEAYKQFFEELPYSVLQASNFLFVQQVGYFDAENVTSPLLHTWSLGVEEQFHPIWPLLLMAVHRFWEKGIVYILLGLAVVSFAYSQYHCLASPKIAFYMLHSRAWELALGGLLVVGNIPEIKSRSLNNVLAVTGLGLVLAGSEITLVLGCGIFFSSLLLATLSYYVVERPLRYGTLPQWPVNLLGRVNALPSPSHRIISYFSFLILLPLFLSWIFASTVWFEKNRVVTTMTMDVELLDSTNDPSKEYIALYWPEGKSSFSGENSVSLQYDTENKLSGNTYQFNFKIPDLSILKSIRLDLLTREGAVKITKIVVSGGFFKVKQSLDVETLYNNISWPFPDIKPISFRNGIMVERSGIDPYFSLISPPPSNKFDYILLFACFAFLFLLFALFAWLLKENKSNRAI